MFHESHDLSQSECFEKAVSGFGLFIRISVISNFFDTFGKDYDVQSLQSIFGELTPGQIELGKIVQEYWTIFMKNDGPNGDGLIKWPKYEGNNVIYLGNEITTGPRKKLM